jgi:hypothetical protein
VRDVDHFLVQIPARVGALRAVVAVFLGALLGLAVIGDPVSATVVPTSPLEALDGFSFDGQTTVVLDRDPEERLALTSTGVFAAPASHWCDVADTALGLRTIGVATDSRMWLGPRSNRLERVKAKSYEFWFSCGSHPAFWARFSPELPDGLAGTPETTSGVAATRYDIPVAALAPSALLADAPMGVSLTSLTVWVADDGGWLVGLDASLTGANRAACTAIVAAAIALPRGSCSVDLDMRVDRVNDPSLRVDTPATR